MCPLGQYQTFGIYPVSANCGVRVKYFVKKNPSNRRLIGKYEKYIQLYQK
jgi:hypothetical protein